MVLTADVRRMSVLKSEDNSISVIHPNAPKTFRVVLQFLKVVSWTLQIVKADRSMENIQFTNNHLPDLPVNFPRMFRIATVIDVLSRFISKGLNH